MKIFRKFNIIFILLFSNFISPLSGEPKKLLEDLDFSQGEWELVGVSLHNYYIVPIQNEIRHFLIRNREVLQDMKKNWVFEQTYNDYCEHHYALRFYKDGKMMKFLKINLHCGYISDGGLSYKMDSSKFTQYRKYFFPLKLSRVGYRSLTNIRKAIQVLINQKDVWLYYDHIPYQYDGFFVVKIDSLPWHANRDSVLQEMKKTIAFYTSSSDFYLKQFIYFVDEGLQSIRYEVYCNKELAQKVPEKMITAGWRGHFDFVDRIDLVFVGINKKEYFELVKGDFND
jgi:hypothetical protein